MRKKGKPKRPSIKTLFGEYSVWHIITQRDRETERDYFEDWFLLIGDLGRGCKIL